MATPAPSPSPPPGALRPPGAPPGPAPGGAVAGRSALEVVLPALLISVALVSTAAITIVDYDDSSVGPVFAAASLVLGGSGAWVLVAGIVLCLRRRAAAGASASLLAVTPVVLADWNIVSRILMGVILIAVPLLIALVLPLASPPREEPRPAALQLSQGAVVVLTLDPVVFFVHTLHGLMGYPAYPRDGRGWEFSPDPPGVYVGFTVILLLGIGALVAVRLRSSRLLYAGLVTAQVVSWIVLGVVEGGALGEYVATLLTLVLALLVCRMDTTGGAVVRGDLDARRRTIRRRRRPRTRRPVRRAAANPGRGRADLHRGARSDACTLPDGAPGRCRRTRAGSPPRDGTRADRSACCGGTPRDIRAARGGRDARGGPAQDAPRRLSLRAARGGRAVRGSRLG